MPTQKESYEKSLILFAKFSKLRRAATEKFVDKLGLRKSQHQMLIEASQESNPCQKDLAEKMEISPAAVTVTLKKLETQGYIERTSSTEDSRVNNIALTSKGKSIVRKTNDFFRTIDTKAFENFSDEEIEQFNSYLQRLVDNLTAYTISR